MMTRTPLHLLPREGMLRSGSVVPRRTWQRLRRPLVFRGQFAAPRRRVPGSTFLLPPVVFVDLLGALWAWTCMMMVVFQNKIIYMPGIPLNARRERIAD